MIKSQKAPDKEIIKKKDFNFFYDVVKLVSGNGFVQVIRGLLSPIISRQFLPEFFGIAQNFSSIANILAVISSFRYDQTIMLPEKDEQAANQLAISVLITLITTPFAFLLVLFFRHDLADLLNSPNLANYLWVVPLQVFAIGSFNIFRQWIVRKRQFLQLSIAQVTNEIVADGMTAGFGFSSMAGSGVMIISRISGQILALLTLGLIVLKEDGKFIFNNLRWQKIKTGIREYRKFPIYNVWASFMSTFSLYIPGVILSAFFSPTIAGYFSYGQSVLRLPVTLIGNSIGHVFYQRGAKAYHDGKLASTVEETLKRLILFGSFPMLVVMLIGKELFATVFGAEWTEAGIYSQILSLWTLLIFIAAPLGNITKILGKNEISVVLNIVKVFTSTGSLIIGGLTGNIYLGLWLFTITGIISYGWFIFWATTTAGIPFKRSTNYFIKNLLFCIPFLGTIYLFQQFNPLPTIYLTRLNLSLPNVGLIIFSCFIGAIYFLIAIFQDKSIREATHIILKKYKIIR